MKLSALLRRLDMPRIAGHGVILEIDTADKLIDAGKKLGELNVRSFYFSTSILGKTKHYIVIPLWKNGDLISGMPDFGGKIQVIPPPMGDKSGKKE